MAIAIDGQRFEDEWDHAMRSLAPNYVDQFVKSKLHVVDPTLPYDDSPTGEEKNTRMFDDYINKKKAFDPNFMNEGPKKPDPFVVNPEKIMEETDTNIPLEWAGPFSERTGSFNWKINLQRPITEGNIDLSTRPIVPNADGTISTVRSIDVALEGDKAVLGGPEGNRRVLIPTIRDDGKAMSDIEAVEHYNTTGKHLGIFNNAQEASSYAQQLHQDQDRMYSQPSDKEGVRDYIKDAPERGAIDKLTGATGERYQLWPERIARELVHSFHQTISMANGTAYIPHAYDDPMIMGESGQMIKPGDAFSENIKSLIDTGAVFTFTPAPLVSKIADGTLGSIAGISAKTANQDMLKLAQKQAENGRATEKIWQDTGWYKGTDGQWKFEIPSGGAKFTEKMINEHSPLNVTVNEGSRKNLIKTTLGEILDFPALYKAYPELKDVAFQLDSNLKTFGSALHTEKGVSTISINLNKILADPFAPHPMEVVLHEVQHVIQRKEGFDQGTNPKSAFYNAIDFVNKRLREYEEKNDHAGIESMHRIKEAMKNFPEKFGLNLYKKTPGEVEARLVEIRRGRRDTKEESLPRSIERGAKEGWLPKPLPMDPRRYTGQTGGREAAHSEVTQFRRAANENKNMTTEEQLAAVNKEYNNNVKEMLEKYGQIAFAPAEQFEKHIDLARRMQQLSNKHYDEQVAKLQAESDRVFDVTAEWNKFIKKMDNDEKRRKFTIVPKDDK